MKLNTNNPSIQTANLATLSQVAEIIGKYMININIPMVASKNREAEYVFQRACIIHVLLSSGMTYAKAGSVINRDHATAIYLHNYANQPRRNGYYANKLIRFKEAFDTADTNKMINEHIDFHKQRIAFHSKEIEKLTSQLTTTKGWTA